MKQQLRLVKQSRIIFALFMKKKMSWMRRKGFNVVTQKGSIEDIIPKSTQGILSRNPQLLSWASRSTGIHHSTILLNNHQYKAANFWRGWKTHHWNWESPNWRWHQKWLYHQNGPDKEERKTKNNWERRGENP